MIDSICSYRLNSLENTNENSLNLPNIQQNRLQLRGVLWPKFCVDILPNGADRKNQNYYQNEIFNGLKQKIRKCYSFGTN